MVANTDFDKICQDILNLDSKVRFTGICDETGEIKHGGQTARNSKSTYIGRD